ncbi:UxaA family hydrolase [Loigolactobacillus coryniformis]|uniref:UxaA family hydrolase n=1 Tax=Loigolactobacillus coryniformis TaxID=1610 RepID=UPI001C5D1D64|nr:altronate dehydratase family protein [Loigolactobacillus coryniformis]MBW4803721.1 altronate dehydratase [Loigolactobacillus coryniformis subsp. torquens]MBW4806423.1 altronate dehydratase [Loigolactobacillus coryniformis subsp. torquens]
MNQFIILNPADTVAVALQDIPVGTALKTPQGTVTTLEEVKRGHKVALKDFAVGDNVTKYGFPIGHATEKIAAGAWVHTHNLKTNLDGELSYTYQPQKLANAYAGKQDSRTFMGYKRPNGKVGIRNDLYIIPTVGCINPLLDIVVQQFKALHPDNGSFDNVILLKHPYGCSQLGDDFEQTRKILVDAALQPNAGGVLIFGLGCENNQMDGMEKAIEAQGGIDPQRMKFLISQEVDDELGLALDYLEELNDAAADDVRTPQPLSELKIGLKCGGSDGLSGVTANPLLGQLSDFVTAQGGSTVLTEVPEMFGAETILMSRAKDEATFQKIVALINNFKAYFESFHQPIYENPSPGNKEGGISTLEDKSLGCTQKSGHSPVNDVLQYGEKIRQSGLTLLQAPGNDLVSSSAEASADCQMVLFTTGRGTPFATYVPTVKVASNSYIANKKPRWIDFDAGQLLEKSMAELADEFIQYIIDVASGEKTNNEKYGIHGLAIFKTGVTE